MKYFNEMMLSAFMRRSLIVAIMVIMGSNNISAQEYIDRNFTISKSINVIMLPGSKGPLEGTAKLEVVNFGAKGNTIIMTLDLPEVKKINPNINMEFAWTGKNIHLLKVRKNNNDNYIIMRGQRTICGMICYTTLDDGKGVWAAQIEDDTDASGCISDIHVGMTRFAVEQKVMGLGLSKFIFERNDGNMKVYSLKWIDLKKKYHWFGRDDYHYEMTNDKTYGSFWFDSNDKLAKWILP